MGYRQPTKTARIVGTDEWEGLEAEALLSPIPMRFSFDLQTKAASGDPEQIKAAYMDFGDTILRSWNLVDADGEPIPATGEGVLQADARLVGEIIARWGEAVAQPPLPTGGLHSNGHSPALAARPSDGVEQR